MTAIKFQGVVVNDSLPPMTMEEAIRFYANYAGLHTQVFDSLVDEDGTSLTNWSTHSGTWAISSDQISGTGPGGNAWGILMHNNSSLPAEGIIEFDKDSARGGILFRAESATIHFLFYWTASTVVFARVEDSVLTVISSLPVIFAGPAHVVLAFRELSFTEMDQDNELMMSAWVDGQHVLTARYNIDGVTQGTKIGLACYDTDSGVAFDNIRMPELTTFANWFSLDPGETATSGLKRLLGSSAGSVRYFVRFDGSLRVWKTKADGVTKATLGLDDIYDLRQQVDTRKIVSHVRVIGAWHEVEAFRSDLFARYGHRFEEVHDPNLMSAVDCHDKGVKFMYQRQEEATQITFNAPALVLLEPEDIISVDGTRYVITSIDAKASDTSLIFTIQARLYLYEA